jgi:E3 ubiquitin-protein ligase RNF14
LLNLFFCFDEFFFQIYIRYDLPDGAEVRAKLSSATENLEGEECPDDGTEDNGNEFSYIYNVEYLPPLILTCLLPRSYPSKDPPYFTITARWMDGPNVTQLCEMLDTIWAELPEQEVIYRWVEWVQNSSLAYLWCDGKVTLGPDVPMQRADNCAISRSLPLKSVIPSMLSYSSKKRYQAFLEDLHMCMICLNQSKGKPFFLAQLWQKIILCFLR